MDFGIFNLMQQRGANVTSAELVDDAIRHTRIAESLGFGRAWFAEHHFSNYSLCPSPLMMVAHAAAVTERIRLGTAVIVAPLHMPARLLGEIGLADSFSGALEAKVARLEHELHTAHTILDVQGKVAGLLGLNLEHGTRC